MRRSSRRTLIAVSCGVVATSALLVGCSSTSTPSTSTSASSSESASASSSGSKGLTAEQVTYCKAVTTWGTSATAASVKAAVASKDAAKVKAAMTAYIPETQAVIDSVPADAPASVTKAYGDLLAAVTATGGGTLTAAQSAALAQANPIVSKYYASVCN